LETISTVPPLIPILAYQGIEHLSVLVMPQRCHANVDQCPFGSQCRAGICFWSHCLADQGLDPGAL
jgi:hypothetical protein